MKAQGRLADVMEREPDKNFSDYQTQTFQNAKVGERVVAVEIETFRFQLTTH